MEFDSKAPALINRLSNEGYSLSLDEDFHPNENFPIYGAISFFINRLYTLTDGHSDGTQVATKGGDGG
jgi:hypothetical protein